MSFGRASRKPYDRPAARPRTDDDRWLHDKAPNGADAGPRLVAAASPNSKLVVKDLHYNVTAKDLVSIFGQVGTLVREPVIKYDRSGRSTGIAFVHFETPEEATRAIKQFNGMLAKGEAMTISYDTRPERARRAGSAPPSLVDRISKPPLIERLAGGAPDVKPKIKQQTPAQTQSGVGPTRGRERRKNAKPPKAKKEPKTAEDLDKELEDFMNVDE